METRRVLREPGELRALAHPVRVSIMEHLGYHGPATATEIADAIDDSPSNCSWHLRKLAEFGLVEPAEASDGKQRPWRIAFESVGLEGDGELLRPAEATILQRQLDRLLAARGKPELASGYSSWGVWLTPAERAEIDDDLRAIHEKLLARNQRRFDESTRPTDATLCEVVWWVTELPS